MAQPKKNKCGRCGHPNPAPVRYCQKCGGPIKASFSLFESLQGDGGVVLAGFASSAIGPGPPVVGKLSINREAEALRKEYAATKAGSGPGSLILPLEDGGWYCPNCGCRNHSGRHCRSCDMDFR